MMRLVAAAMLLWGQAAMADPCRPDRVSIRGAFGQAQFTVQIADTDALRSQGLMHVPAMDQDAGMLFVYDRPQYATFWMRNTLIPLDMVFADSAGRVLRIHRDAVPLDETVIDGGPGIRFVLEINAGLSEKLGFAPGAQLRHPAINASQAAWPCE